MASTSDRLSGDDIILRQMRDDAIARCAQWSLPKHASAGVRRLELKLRTGAVATV
jgi:hypothetical protein